MNNTVEAAPSDRPTTPLTEAAANLIEDYASGMERMAWINKVLGFLLDVKHGRV